MPAPLIVGPATEEEAATVAGNGLDDLIYEVANRLSGVERIRTSSAGSAANKAVFLGLRDFEAAALGNTAKHGGKYWYALDEPIRGEQQRVQRTGFNGTTGQLIFANSFSTAPPQGVEGYLMSVIPAIAQDSLRGIRECINTMLTKFWVRYRIPFTAVEENVITYPLGSLWWAKVDRFKRLLQPPRTTLDHPASAYMTAAISQRGEQWYLELGSPFQVDDEFWLEALVPANAALYTGAAGWRLTSAPTAGLVDGDDACLGDWGQIVQCALWETVNALAEQAGGARKAHWARIVTDMRTTIVGIKAFQMDDQQDGALAGMETVVSPGGGWGWGSKGIFG